MAPMAGGMHDGRHLLCADGPLVVDVVGVHELVRAFVDELVDGNILAME